MNSGAHGRYMGPLGPAEHARLPKQHERALGRRQEVEIGGLGPPAHDHGAPARAVRGEEHVPSGVRLIYA